MNFEKRRERALLEKQRTEEAVEERKTSIQNSQLKVIDYSKSNFISLLPELVRSNQTDPSDSVQRQPMSEIFHLKCYSNKQPHFS